MRSPTRFPAEASTEGLGLIGFWENHAMIAAKAAVGAEKIAMLTTASSFLDALGV